MSQLKLSGDASGTGIVTVAAPNTNSTYTVTLPAAAGTIVTGAAGSDTQVQFNDSGSFGGDAGLTYNKTTDTLTATGGFSGPHNGTVGATTASSGVFTTCRANSWFVGSTNLTMYGDTSSSVGVVLSQAGNMTIQNGNLVIGTSGKGIDFSATSGTGTSELLSDYEEGTWTPTIIATATNPTVSYNTNGQRGYYTKIGRVVYFQAFLGVSSISSGSGDLLCGGLPFTVGGDVGTLRTWGNIVVGTSGVNWGTSKTALAGYARGGETSIYVLAMQNDSSWGGIPIGNVANGDEMVWSGWYQV